VVSLLFLFNRRISHGKVAYEFVEGVKVRVVLVFDGLGKRPEIPYYQFPVLPVEWLVVQLNQIVQLSVKAPNKHYESWRFVAVEVAKEPQEICNQLTAFSDYLLVGSKLVKQEVHDETLDN